jgi:hypothetical protein
MTRMSFQGACHSGFGWRYASLRIRLVDEGRSRCDVGPFAFGGAGPFPRIIKAFDAFFAFVTSSRSVMPSIIFAILSSEALSGAAAFAFFALLCAADAAAPACFAANAGGSSFASLYSLRIREATFI